VSEPVIADENIDIKYIRSEKLLLSMNIHSSEEKVKPFRLVKYFTFTTYGNIYWNIAPLFTQHAPGKDHAAGKK